MGGFLSKDNFDISRALELVPMYNGGGGGGWRSNTRHSGRLPEEAECPGGNSKEEFQRK